MANHIVTTIASYVTMGDTILSEEDADLTVETILYEEGDVITFSNIAGRWVSMHRNAAVTVREDGSYTY